VPPAHVTPAPWAYGAGWRAASRAPNGGSATTSTWCRGSAASWRRRSRLDHGWLFWVVATHRWQTNAIGVATALVAAHVHRAHRRPADRDHDAAADPALAAPPRLSRGLVVSIGVALIESVIAIFVLPAMSATCAPSEWACSSRSARPRSAGIVLDASSLAIRKPGFMVGATVCTAGQARAADRPRDPAGLISGPFAVIGVWRRSPSRPRCGSSAVARRVSGIGPPP